MKASTFNAIAPVIGANPVAPNAGAAKVIASFEAAIAAFNARLTAAGIAPVSVTPPADDAAAQTLMTAVQAAATALAAATPPPVRGANDAKARAQALADALNEIRDSIAIAPDATRDLAKKHGISLALCQLSFSTKVVSSGDRAGETLYICNVNTFSGSVAGGEMLLTQKMYETYVAKCPCDHTNVWGIVCLFRQGAGDIGLNSRALPSGEPGTEWYASDATLKQPRLIFADFLSRDLTKLFASDAAARSFADAKREQKLRDAALRAAGVSSDDLFW